MNIIALALNNLIHTQPSETSNLLHKQFQDSLKETSFDIDKLKDALDECKTLSDLNLKYKVLEVLSIAIKNMSIDDRWNRIDALIHANTHIAAIKLYRELFGAGLAQSKIACDERRKLIRGY